MSGFDAFFNASPIITALREEMRSLADRRSFAGPAGDDGIAKDLNLTMEQKIDRMLKDGPTPPDDMLRRVLHEVFVASLLAEEGRRCTPRLIFSIGEPIPTHHFEAPVELTSRQLRKLGPTLGPRDVFVWEIADGTPVVTGIEVRPRPWNARH